MKAFIDTNVLLDILLPNRPSHNASRLVLQAAKMHLLDIQISTQSLTDTEYILSRNGIDFKVFADLTYWLLNNVSVDGPNSLQLRDALTAHSGDFEDDFQYAFAEDCDCDILITGDRKFIQRKTPGDILMMTPEEFVARMR
jgi:predicted nucleic acid-binding protein